MNKSPGSIKSDEIKQMIKEVLSIIEEIPEAYKQKSYEILFTAFLQNRLWLQPPQPRAEPAEKEIIKTTKFVIPIDVKAYLQQYGIAEEKMSKLFLFEENEVRATYKITIDRKATAQTQIALLTALENALMGGKFEFSVEAVRQRCVDHARYDASNFMPNFRYNSKLFKSLADAEHVELSPDGKAELADVILEIVK